MQTNIVSINLLQEYYFTGNIPDIRIATAVPIEVVVQLNSTYSSPDLSFEINELHEPDSDGNIYISVSDIMNNILRASWGGTPFGLENHILQSNAIAEVIITPGEMAPASFQVIKGSVNTQTDPYTSFNFQSYIQNNLLNTCPQIQEVGIDQPNAINYYIFGAGKISLKAKVLTGYNPAGEPQYADHTADLVAISTPNIIITVNAMFSHLASKFTIDPAHEIIHIDVYGVNTGNSAETTPVRLIPVQYTHQNNDLFAFENSLGCIDVIRFTGVLSEIIDHEYLSLINRKHRLEHNAILLTAYKKNTGYFESQEEADFAADFFASSQRYHYSNSEFKRIFITEKDAVREHHEISAYTFNFAYAHQHPGRLLNRQEEL